LRERIVEDAIYIAMTVLFFALSLAYAHFCEKVR